MFITTEKGVLEKQKVFIPKKRPGTKSFMDVPKELKEKDFDSAAGHYFKRILPSEVFTVVKKAVMETGIESVEASKWLEYALGTTDGKINSLFTQWVNEAPYNPRVFKILYGIEDVFSSADIGFIKTRGAHAIYLRLQSIIDRLPQVIMDERKRFGLQNNEKLTIFNVGAAYGLDTILMIAENPWLKDLVRIVHIDPDEESLVCGYRYAKKLGVADCFQFVPEKIEDVKWVEKAHMLLFIGMFCPIPTKKCILTLNFISKFLVEDGTAIFSTVQEKMLMQGPLLDFLMWVAGWRMYFKKDDEPGKIARLAGLIHEKKMDWEDELGHNRVTVARKPAKTSFWKSALNLAQTMLL